MSGPQDDLLASIDMKLGALLSLAIADRLPETARASNRPLDEVLRDAGLPVAEIAALMGKSPQAVRQVLDAQDGSSSRKKRPRRTTDG